MATDTVKSTNPTTAEDAPGHSLKKGRRRRTAGVAQLRYFLPQSGSTTERPELGQEAASEGEALVEARKSGQVFYSVMVWRAVLEMKGTEARIVKQPFSSG